MSRNRLGFYLAIVVVLALLLTWGWPKKEESPSIKNDSASDVSSTPPKRALSTPRLDPHRESSKDVSPQDMAHLEGFVRSDSDLKGIDDATIRFFNVKGDRVLTIKTKNNGGFRTSIAPGAYRVKITASGYADYLDGRRLIVMDRAHVDSLVFRLVKRVRLSGLIVDRKAMPIANLSIQLSQAEFQGRSLALDTRVKSGVDGRFQIDVPMGKVFLSVYNQKRSQLVGPLFLSHTRIKGLRIVMGQGLSLHGKLTGPLGSQLKEPQLATILLKENRTTRKIGVNRDGIFRVGGLTPGRKLLQAQSPGFSPSRVLSMRVSRSGSNMATLALVKRVNIRGVVIDPMAGDDPTSIAGVRIEARPNSPANDTMLVDSITTTSGPDGRFVLNHVPDLPLVISGRSVFGKIALRRGVAKQMGEIKLPLMATGGIAGVVSDGKKGQRISVFSIDVMNAQREKIRYHIASRKGQYVLSGLEQGVYSISYSAFKKARTTFKALSVVGGTNIRQDVILNDSGRIDGTVRSQAGLLIPGARVEIRSDSFYQVVTDSQGVYRFDQAPRGLHEISAHKDAYVPTLLKNVSAFADERRFAPNIKLKTKLSHDIYKQKGIGLALSQTSKGMQIERVDPQSPAKIAGLKPGDLLVEINGKAALDSQSAKSLLNGWAGSDVKLRVLSAGSNKEIVFSVLREL